MRLPERRGTGQRRRAVPILLAAAGIACGTALADDAGHDTAAGGAAGNGPADKPAFRVVDGYKVDAYTMMGFRTWRAAACDRCHGANQEGLVGPSLIQSLKTLSKEDFVKTVRDGRQERGMVSFASSKMVMENIDALYTYLKGRSSGDITRARVEELKP
jgi:mono/diheme cytochrome c family protein